MAVLDFSKTNKNNYKNKGDYGVRVARPGFDAENCAQNQLLFNSNWPILQICKVIDLDKKADYEYKFWDIANQAWVDNPDTSGLDVRYVISINNVSVGKSNLVYTAIAEGLYNSSYQLKYWRFKYKKYNHGLGYVPFFFRSEEVSNIEKKVILTSVDISTDVDYPYTEGPLPMLTPNRDYGISSSSIFGGKVPGLCSNMFSKLVQAVKTTETSRWVITDYSGDEKILCWSPFSSAGEAKAGVVNKYEAFSFSAYNNPFFNANCYISFLDTPNDAINSNLFGDGPYFSRDAVVRMLALSQSSSLYDDAMAYSNIEQNSLMYNDASLVILRSPMVSPEYEEIEI